MSIDLGRAVASHAPPGEALEVKRRAVVVARGGALGAGQTLTTIQHLISAWHDVEEWDTVIVAPRDPHVTQLIDGLGGDLTVEREGADVAGIVAAAAREGRTASVFFAGDAVPALPHPAPLSVALVDVMGCDAAGVFGASMTSSHPAHDGEGLLTWERAVDPDVRQPVVVFTNASLHEAPRYRAAHKVAWLVESPEVLPETTRFAIDNEHLFDLVITNDVAAARLLRRAVVVPAGGCWIPPADQVVARKRLTCSMIASRKGFTTGHRLRHEIVPLLGGVDLFGRGHNGLQGFRDVENKAEALGPYMFSIVIENTKSPAYFSEKLIDAFRCGTIPIYWGAEDALRTFDPRGMIPFDDPSEIPMILARATPDHYREHLDAVHENFRRAASWRVAEDRLYPLLRPYASMA